MEKSPQSEPDGQRKLMIPRRMVPLVWGLIILFIHMLLPWAVARIGPHYGWSQGTPSWWNLAGLLFFAAGLGLYIWCLVFHYRTYRAPVSLGFAPPHLVTAGPYQVSRNPMYVSGLFGWLGWVIFYGSPAVMVALVLLWAIFALRVIPQEEHQLEALFGDEYTAYKHSVRRWLGRT
jgi:protein-S-isoprenylcysteine O-methyltransferase Ste14